MANATELPLPGSAPASRRGFSDSLGDRVIVAGTGENELLEVLHLRRELTAVSSFEFALRERAARLANFQHNAYARVRQIDRLPPPDGRLAIVSDHVPGWRLAEILSAVQERHLELDINAALSLVKQLVHAVAILHQHARGVAHGALGPERLVVTAHARLVVVEYVLGSALERLQMPRERLWRELRVAIPSAAGGAHLDARADVTQIGTIAMALVLGCPLAADDFPDHMAELLAMATENRALGGRRPVSKPLRAWLTRALQLDLHRSFPSAIEAESELEALLIAEPSYVAAPVALETFLAAYQRSTPAAVTVEEEEPSAEDADTAEQAVDLNPAETEPAEESRIELDGVIADLDHLLDESAPAKQPAVVFEPAERPAPARPRPVLESVPRAEMSVPKRADAPVQRKADIPVPRTSEVPVHKAADVPIRKTPDVPVQRKADVPPPRKEKGSLFASQVGTVAEADREERDDERAVDEQPGKKTIMRPLLVVAALLVLAVGGFFVYKAVAPGMQQPATGTLSVESQPAGLAVKVDGTPRGVTPFKATLAPGPHQLEIDTGSQPRVIPITITAGGTVSQYIEAQAVPATGKLQVTSDPPGATVLVDGERKGTAPVLVADLAVGRHRVELQADGATVRQEVTIDPGGTSSILVPVSSARNAPVSGWVSVSSPVELQVYEGTELLGTTQSERILMMAGRHDLDVVNDTLGFRQRQTVQVPPGKLLAIKVQLPKGSLSVNAIPWADVLVDGQPAGQTPIGNLSLTIGPHEILFRHPQFGEQKHAVTVTAKAPTRLSVDLRK